MNLLEHFPDIKNIREDLGMYFGESLIFAKTAEQGEYSWQTCYGIDLIGEKMKNPLTDLGAVLLDYHERKSRVVPLGQLDVEITFPEEGWYAFKRTAVLLNRSPMRQNRKGVCRNTIDPWNIYEHVARPFIGKIADPTKLMRLVGDESYLFVKQHLEDYAAILNDGPSLFSLDRAVAAVTTKKALARPVSRTFCVSLGIQNTNPTLWFYNIPIGSLELQSGTVIVDSPMFLQEAIDFFQPQGLTVKG